MRPLLFTTLTLLLAGCAATTPPPAASPPPAETAKPATALQYLYGSAEAEVAVRARSEEHTSELQSLMRISYAFFCLIKKNHEAYHNYPISTLTRPTTCVLFVTT